MCVTDKIPSHIPAVLLSVSMEAIYFGFASLVVIGRETEDLLRPLMFAGATGFITFYDARTNR